MNFDLQQQLTSLVLHVYHLTLSSQTLWTVVYLKGKSINKMADWGGYIGSSRVSGHTY